MKNLSIYAITLIFFGFNLSSCQPESIVDEEEENEVSLHKAFEEFDSDNFVIYLDGNEVVLESNGWPNHTSPYWSSPYHAPSTATEEHELFVQPTVTSFNNMAPGYIDSFNGSYTLRVSANPEKASRTSSTGLGAIGMAISGGMIYNDQEGPNVPLDNAAGSLDYSGAHTGPQSYHYHLEPKAWSDDDHALIGIIADGFFLYGRKCHSTGAYPADLDESGGHTSITQHTEEAEYHYHIMNEIYLNQFYILFPEDYQGTPNAIQ